MPNHAKFKIIFALAILAALAGVLAGKKIVRAALPALKEGTFLSGQTLSVWPSWSTLGNALGQALPMDPINQLGTAGTCATTTNRFCLSNSQCPSGENCVLHDPETGWSTTDRRFSFACSAASYAYRYIVATSGQAYTVRARFEDPGISIYNWKNFTAGFISSTLFKISEPSGVCNQDQEISTLQSGVCGDGRLNLNKGEQCDPPGRIEYQLACSGANRNLTICNNNCQWVASTTLCSSLSQCGNGLVEAGENCDDGVLNGRYGHCGSSCNWKNDAGYCGDDVVQTAYEVCDPSVDDSDHIDGTEKYSLTSRADSCSWDCQNWGPYCGDRTVQTQYGEECDGSQSCVTATGGTGVKICTSDCKMSPSATSSAAWFCTATTTPVSPGASGSCGNGVVDASEACDQGTANNGLPCVPAYGVSCSYCSADCQNTIDVQPTQYCGNGTIEATEKCEKTVGGTTIYSVTANSLSTEATINTAANGYREKLCSEENLGANKAGKGTKTCADCSLARNCLTCGLDPTGVEVNGRVLNVLQTAFSGQPDPLMVEGSWIRSLKLYFNTPALDSCANRVFTAAELSVLTPEERYNKTQCYFNALGPATYVPILAAAYKKPSTPAVGLDVYTLQTTATPPANAKLNSNLLCSTGEEPTYTMVINNDYTHRFQFPVLSDPSPGQYDIVASPIITSTRSRDVRVVVSWESTDEFFGGFVRPGEAEPSLEGDNFAFCSDPPGPEPLFCLTNYAIGTRYYAAPFDAPAYKKTGIWYHGFISSGKRAESFTIDTAAMASGAYAFYVRTPGAGIESLKNIAKLKVEVFVPETDSTGNRLFGAPARSYYLKDAIVSENHEAGYWHVFNLSQPSSGAAASVSNVIDVNRIITNAADIAIGSCTGRPAGAVCRPGFIESLCDVPESCTGASDFCPADVFRSAGTLCRASAPASLGCDLAESCSGASPECPNDSYAPAGTNCGTIFTCNAIGQCDTCSPGYVMCGASGCVLNKNGTSCNDGNPCTINDTYHDACGTASSCYGTAKNCNDGLAWTTDSCNSGTGACVNTLNSCDDGNLCTVGDAYNLAGACVGGPWTPANCCRDVADCTLEDTNPCLISTSCLPTNRCRYDLDPSC